MSHQEKHLISTDRRKRRTGRRKGKRYFSLDRGELECSRCLQILPLDSFYPQAGTDTGFRYWCNFCINDAQNERRDKTGRESEAAAQRRRYAEKRINEGKTYNPRS